MIHLHLGLSPMASCAPTHPVQNFKSSANLSSPGSSFKIQDLLHLGFFRLWSLHSPLGHGRFPHVRVGWVTAQSSSFAYIGPSSWNQLLHELHFELFIISFLHSVSHHLNFNFWSPFYLLVITPAWCYFFIALINVLSQLQSMRSS